MPMTQRSELHTRLGRFEILSAIVDSGATVPVMNPTTGASYEVVPGSANGTEYEIANGETIEDMGEKRMAVLTTEGSLRGYGSRCADVTKALQSVRALVTSDHAVCFGLGDGTDHVIINKVSGEVKFHARRWQQLSAGPADSAAGSSRAGRGSAGCCRSSSG